MSSNSECYEALLFVQVYLISIELVDKVVDAVMLKKYSEGKVSNNPQDSVYYALVAFFITGLLISFARITLSILAIKKHCSSREDRINEAIRFWSSLAKVWLEALPQAIFGRFFFGECAVTDDLKQWGQAFGLFSLLPFIQFLFHLIYYWCPYCKYQHDEKPNPLTLLAVSSTLKASLLGIFCAVKTIIAFTERCTF